ncbi:NAD(P)H-binding protein [Streptomyces malaysiensis]|uniref:NAD(P)H-binding protein n=1 Tax=Streptomyces malaysiensis TaxID=92644 RepID=UPI001AD93F28
MFAMKVFVTGASGGIGSLLVPELIAAGHEVLGLARSDAAAQSVSAAGAGVLRGEMTNPETLRAGAKRPTPSSTRPSTTAPISHDRWRTRPGPSRRSVPPCRGRARRC